MTQVTEHIAAVEHWTGVNQSRSFRVLSLVVLFSALLRYVLASRNSYWLDELYSVEQYVLSQGSVTEAMRSLAESSVHPPLYQFVLYFWVSTFGNGEAVTRTLSNIYATLAVILFHRMVAKSFGASLANLGAIVFALTYSVMFQGMETRSYAQTLMLSTASSLLVLAYMRSRSQERSLKHLSLAWGYILLGAINVGLLLTHYYNVFFWASQVVFLVGFTLRREPRGSRVSMLAILALNYLLQLAAFIILWGKEAQATFQRNTGAYEIEGAMTYTFDTVLSSVTSENFRFGPLSSGLVLLATSISLFFWIRRRSRHLKQGYLPHDVDATVYLSAMTLLPALAVNLLFVLLGAERFLPKYLIYIVPSITLLLLLAGRAGALHLWRLVLQRTGRSDMGASRFASATLMALALLVVLPGTIDATTHETQDWRGTAADISAIVDSNPDYQYVVLETSFRRERMLNYYLRRNDPDLRVTATITRGEETRNEGFQFERRRDVIEEGDYLIVPFIHHRVRDFPNALGRLTEMYSVHHRQIDSDGKGIIIFDLSSPDS
jgi:uncharacterized membrane protein